MKRLACALVALGALVELGADALIRARTPTDEDWRAAAAFVRAGHRGGDGVVFAPAWVEPLGRLHLGELVPVKEAARADRARQGRIWEVSIRGKAQPEAAGRVTEERRFGRVRVRRIERRAARVLYDFTERGAVAGAAPKVAEVAFRPYACLPAPPGRTLEFPDVPLGAEIAVGGGIDDFQSRYASSAPVALDVAIDGAPVARLPFAGDGWERARVGTARFAGGRHAVRFAVRGPRADRTFCFHAEAR